jgi:hypothetical protein
MAERVEVIRRFENRHVFAVRAEREQAEVVAFRRNALIQSGRGTGPKTPRQPAIRPGANA